MIPLSTLRNLHTNHPAAILGGGPSDRADFAALPQNSILFAVNDHALHYCHPDYLVYMDIPNPQILPELARAVDDYHGIKIAPHALSDVDLNSEGIAYWDGGFTSTLATWLALFMGCDPVLLCGMDCYQGEVKYSHPRPDFYHPVFDFPLENHLGAWRLALQHCPNPERIRAMSGPLTQVFGAYK